MPACACSKIEIGRDLVVGRQGLRGAVECGDPGVEAIGGEQVRGAEAVQGVRRCVGADRWSDVVLRSAVIGMVIRWRRWQRLARRRRDRPREEVAGRGHFVGQRVLPAAARLDRAAEVIEAAPAGEHQRDAVVGRGGDALLPQRDGIFVAVVEIASEGDAAQCDGVGGTLLEDGAEVELGGDGVPGHSAQHEIAEREHRAVVGELASGGEVDGSRRELDRRRAAAGCDLRHLGRDRVEAGEEALLEGGVGGSAAAQEREVATELARPLRSRVGEVAHQADRRVAGGSAGRGARALDQARRIARSCRGFHAPHQARETAPQPRRRRAQELIEQIAGEDLSRSRQLRLDALEREGDHSSLAV